MALLGLLSSLYSRRTSDRKKSCRGTLESIDGKGDSRHRRGEIRTRDTADIDREIIHLSNRRHPKFCLFRPRVRIPKRYCKSFAEHFGDFLRCKTDVLFLNTPPSAQEIRRKIFSADVVYVGGGNTLYMMCVWRRLGMDQLLRAAHESGIILAGISAGANCWFDSGHSDSMSFYNPRNWKYINVKGLIHGVHCPHYNGVTRGVPRRKAFRGSVLQGDQL
jgi:dipeptidase E